MARVLVVDDDPDIQLLLRLELAAEGHDVLTADNGVEALAVLRADDPDLVLLDVMMPELDGWGVLERIDPDSAPPVVLVSAIGHQVDVVARALDAGAVDVIPKPFDPVHVLALVNGLLTLDRAGRQAHRADRLGER